MRRLQKRRGHHPSLLNNLAFPDKGRLLKAGIFSLLLHFTLVVAVILGMRPTIAEMPPSIYRVTIRPFSPVGNGGPLGSSTPGGPGSSVALPASPPVEKPKPTGHQKKSEKTEGIKSVQKKAEKKVENVEKGWSSEKRKRSLQSLEEAMEDIHKKAALEEIRKKVALRERSDKGSTGEPSKAHSSQESTVSGSGSGTGTGSGTLGSPTGGSPWGSPFGGSSALESKLNDYYDMIWAKIKKEWILPGGLPKGKTDLETIIVVVIERDGKVQKTWFEKKSGNALYDQTAMRAIKKAEPLPPIPKEFRDDIFEIGIRFYPD
jgi:colicin import membrane protein